MCWNEDVSLNTFLFGLFVLCFIAYNNEYTRYKTEEFSKCPTLYAFLFSVILMQLVEHYLWRSIHNRNERMNQLFSILGWFLLYVIQPGLAILLIPMAKIRYAALFIYFFALTASVFVYPITWKTTIDEKGHLLWIWADLREYSKIISLFYIIALSALGFHLPIFTVGGAFFLAISYFHFQNSWGSLWCWLSNSLFFYFLIDIILVKPVY
uniref:Uncharacterized protein n=1 Tax=viral metagenome TaxID=1070528 RepID=A0A6C0I483_9ZZZZ